MSRANQWFVTGEGIAREVITADIQRYLGPDALVRPGPGTGEYEGRSGYWITAYRTLTSQMIQDLKMDSTRWQAEQGRQEAGRGVAYQDSRTHAARQHWGPSQAQAQETAYEQPRQAARPQPYPSQQHTQQYPAGDQHYTTAPTAAYGTSTYPAPAAHAAAPRTQPDTYAGYPQNGREHTNYPTQQYPYSQPDAYRQAAAAPPPTHGYAAPSSAAAPGYYIASDGRQYPLPAQQPTQPQRQPQPRRNNP